MPYLYILECVDGTYYTGSAKNLEKRLWEHQNGQGANFTKKRLPVKLVYCEEYSRIDDAFYREKQVQGWSHKKKESLISKNLQDLHSLSECKNESHCANAGFGSAQPAVRTPSRSLSAVEVTVETAVGTNAGFGSAQPAVRDTQ